VTVDDVRPAAAQALADVFGFAFAETQAYNTAHVAVSPPVPA